jgi:MFS family permease
MPPGHTLSHSLRAFPRAFWALVGAQFVTKFGVFVIPFLTLFATRQGFSPGDAGMAAGSYSVGSFGAAIIGGWLADRIGRNTTMAFASLGGACCMLAFSQAGTLASFIVLALLTGFVQESGNPATAALVQDIIPPEHRVNAYAVLRFAVNLGWSLGPACAGWLAEHSFTWLFIGDAATSAVFGLVALLALPNGNPSPRERAGWGFALRHILTNRAFLGLAASQVFFAFAFRQMNSSFPLHFDRQAHPLHIYGWIQALNGAMICTLELTLLSFTRNHSMRGFIGMGYAVLAGSYLLFFAGSSIATFTAVMIVFTIGEMFAFSRQSAYIAALSHEEMRGRYSGFLALSWCLGSSTGAALGLRLYGWNPGALWILCAVFGLAAAGCVSLGRRTEGVRG